MSPATRLGLAGPDLVYQYVRIDPEQDEMLAIVRRPHLGGRDCHLWMELQPDCASARKGLVGPICPGDRHRAWWHCHRVQVPDQPWARVNERRLVCSYRQPTDFRTAGQWRDGTAESDAE